MLKSSGRTDVCLTLFYTFSAGCAEKVTFFRCKSAIVIL